MEALIIKSTNLQERFLSEVKEEVEQLADHYAQKPTIVFIGFGEIPLIQYVILSYVKVAKKAGFHVVTQIKMNDEKEEELIKSIERFNDNPDIDAILLLQPLPPHLDFFRVISKVNPEKEVEGFHPLNLMPALHPKETRHSFKPCMAEAFSALLNDQNIHFTANSEWIVLMDDEFSRNPILEMTVRNGILHFLSPNSSLTIVNTNSACMDKHCKHADVLVVITRQPEIVKAEWLKPGVFIIDIYGSLTNEVPSKSDPYQMRPVILGGVNPNEIKHVASAIIPVCEGLHKIAPCIFLRNAVISFRNKMQALCKEPARHTTDRQLKKVLFASSGM